MEEIFKLIFSAFSSLWKMRMHGETLEVITPFSTSSNLFVSLFVSRREDGFVVSDGGWVSSGMYGSQENDDPMFQRLLDFYVADCEVKSVDAKGVTFHYKKTDDIGLVPNLIFDMAEFVRSVVSGSFINFAEELDRRHQKRFSKQATDFLRDTIKSDSLKIYRPLNDSMGQVRFNAIISWKGKMSLINYVSGSESGHFINSLAKSVMKYSFLEESGPTELVKDKITLVDTSTGIYASDKVKPYIGLVDGTNGREMVLWEQRERLARLAG